MGPWLITFLRLRRRINNSVAAPRHRIHHSPASWWACGRPVPRSVGGIWYGTPGLHNVVHSGGSGGSTVRPQRAICHRGLLCCLYLLLLSAYSKSVCSAAALHQQTASSCQSQSLDFLATSLLLPQSRCQRTPSIFSIYIEGSKLETRYGWGWRSPYILKGQILYPTLWGKFEVKCSIGKLLSAQFPRSALEMLSFSNKSSLPKEGG